MCNSILFLCTVLYAFISRALSKPASPSPRNSGELQTYNLHRQTTDYLDIHYFIHDLFIQASVSVSLGGIRGKLKSV
jgi:hypothetical protein